MGNITWILRFGELGLKSKAVRGSFQRALLNNMMQQAIDFGVEVFVEKQRSQFHVYSNSEPEKVEELLSFVLGVVAIDKVEKLECEYDSKSIAECILNNSDDFGKPRSFGVRVKRMYKYGDISSKDYERTIGSEMINIDEQLSVNLRDPDEWVRIIIDSSGVSRIVKRLETLGGLPTGVQGDVLVNLVNEKTMLESYLIMRRGVRIIPVLESKKDYIEKLSRFDPFIGNRTNERDRYKNSHKRPAWGVVGMEIKDGLPFVGQRDDAVKTTPMSTLSPLDGWIESEVEDLRKHFFNPVECRIYSDIISWIA